VQFDTPFVVNDQTIVSRYREFAQRDFSLLALNLKADLGFATLTSNTSRYEDTREGQADYAGQGWYFYYQLFFDIGIPQFELGGDLRSQRSAYITFDNAYEGLVHETRLTSTGEGPFSYILGVFYTEQEKSLAFSEVLPGMDAYLGGFKVTPSPLPDVGYTEVLDSDYTETAIFGELTWQITDRWRATLGGRYFQYEDTGGVEIIDYAGGAVDNTFRATGEGDGESYFRFNTAFDITDNVLAYFTASQGFRRGGTNGFRDRTGGRIVDPGVRNYGPDSTDNLELGVKGYLFDRRLYVATDVYQITWRDVQTYFAQDINGFPINGTANGPDAVSRGWELESRFKLNDNWTFSYATSTVRAEWDETKRLCLYLNNTSCRVWEKGGELGGAPEWRHIFGVRYERELSDGSTIFASLRSRYESEVGSDRCDFGDDCSFVLKYPEFTRYNVSAGWSNGDWDATLWISNLTNERVIMSNQPDLVNGRRVILMEPTTIGLNLSWKWD
jgi:iron complex outermembrane recepter protein